MREKLQEKTVLMIAAHEGESKPLFLFFQVTKLKSKNLFAATNEPSKINLKLCYDLGLKFSRLQISLFCKIPSKLYLG